MGFRDEPKNSLTVSVDLLLISFNLISHWPEEEGKEKRIEVVVAPQELIGMILQVV